MQCYEDHSCRNRPRRARSKSEATDLLLTDYIERATRYVPCESQLFDSERYFSIGWTTIRVVLSHAPFCSTAADGNLPPGSSLHISDEFAMKEPSVWCSPSVPLTDGLQRHVIARTCFSPFGRITLPHQLARVVLAEQVYRALTILASHPYHSGH